MKIKDIILTALFAALTAIGAFLKIPFPLAAITMQSFFTAMAAILLGRKYGALSQGVYVLIGLVGIPIFALGGGFSYVFQPTFGFLLGLIPAAWVIGALCRRPLTFWRTALAILAGYGVLYAIGVPYAALSAGRHAQGRGREPAVRDHRAASSEGGAALHLSLTHFSSKVNRAFLTP